MGAGFICKPSRRLPIKQLSGNTGVLGGALEGSRLLAALIEASGPSPNVPEPIFLDFEGVTVATASFLRESVLAFRDHFRHRTRTAYPVIANISPTVQEDLALLLNAENDALLTCSLDLLGKASNVAVLGRLDPKLQATFDHVARMGETDARGLMLAFGGDENIQKTAFNNRLAGLAALGLLAEIVQGKSKRYRPVLQEVHHGR